MSLNVLLAFFTILGGVAALWFFWDKISGWLARLRKSKSPGPPNITSQPSRENIEHVILSSDPAADWNHEMADARSVAAYRRDLNLRFEVNYLDEGKQCDNFVEPWANRHPDPRATGYWCDLYYGSTLVERFILVAVDGGRAMLPIPKKDTDKVLLLDYKVAQIHDTLGTLDEYMARSGLAIYKGDV